MHRTRTHEPPPRRREPQPDARSRYADRLSDRTLQPSIVVPVHPDTIAYTGVAYVVPEWRGRGVASALLDAADAAAGRLGARRLILQTGDRQPDAVRCYTRHGYAPIPVFPPYKVMAYAQCFAKPVRP